MVNPVLFYNKVIFPDNLKQILNRHRPQEMLNLFAKNDFISCITIGTKGEEELDKVCKELAEFLTRAYSCYGKRVLLIDEYEFDIVVNDIKKQINGGMKEDNFTDWFMTMVFQLTQIHAPRDQITGEIKEEYLPVIEYYTSTNEDNTASIGYIFSASKSTLLTETNIHQLISKARKIINQMLNNNGEKSRVRNPIGPKIRHEVFKKDNYKCIECGRGKETMPLHIDHILPISQGGTDELSNLQTLCEQCNLAKSNRCWGKKNG
jgi:hypothetical protein